jgi:hypothetical protein
MSREHNKSQRERFEETARGLGVDLDEEKLKEALRTLAKQGPAPKGGVKRDGEC